MSDSTFRARITPSAATTSRIEEANKQTLKKSDSTANSTEIEVPYTEYKSQNGKPYIVDHYQIGDTWQDSDGGFKVEINTIDTYLREKIESGIMENSIPAIKEAIKKIEKACGVNKEDRTVNKIAKVSAYAEFLLKTRGL